MAQLNTRIISRNDTTDNWAASTDELKAGEIGVEILENGKAKIKIGNGVEGKSTWDQLSYVGGDEAKVFQVGALTEIPEDAELVIGDIAIVKTAINGDETDIENIKYSYTSYVYNGIDAEGKAKWAAMDGNYDATNVYFSDDITLAGSYTRVGNVTKSSDKATGTLTASGKSLAELMQSIFTQELYPATGTSRDVPNIALSGDADASGEVGSSYNLPTVTVKVSDVGSYAYGPATGIKFEAGNLKIAQGAVASASNFKTNASDMVKDSTLSLTAVDNSTLYEDSAKSYTFNASGTYTAGTAPKTNLGNLLDNNDETSSWTYRIPSGTATATARTIKRTGYRNMFAGGTTAATVDSAVIRGFTAKKSSKPTTEGAALEFTAASGTTKVICAYPSGWTGTPYFEMFGLAWAENSNFVAKSNVDVADARGTNEDGTLNGSMAYKVYAWELETPLEAETTKFRVYFK